MTASRLRRAALIGLCLIAVSAPSQARSRPDRTGTSDAVQADQIKPADILLIGDSESLGYFGAQLYRSLSREPDPKSHRPLTVWAYWTCGSDAADWLSGATPYCGVRACYGAHDCASDYGPLDRPGRVRYEALRTYLAKVKPRVTIVSLGSNLLSESPRDFRGDHGSYASEVARLARDIAAGGSQCLWIGPPQVALTTRSVADYERFVADAGKAARAAGCAFIDSNPLSDRKYVLRSDSEGIHYRGEGERAWETKVWAQLKPLLGTLLSR